MVVKRKFKTIVLILVFIIIWSNCEIGIADKMYINNSDYITYIQVRETFEDLGYIVDWDINSKNILLSSKDRTIIIPVGENHISINNEKKTIKYPSLILNDISFITTEVLELLGYDYSVQEDEILITIKPIPEIKVGEKAPDFKLKNIYNKELVLSEIKDEKVVLVFWTSRCSYCRNEMEDIRILIEDERDDVTIIPINIGENLEVVKNYIEKSGYKFPVFLDEDKTVAKLYNIESVPTTLFLDDEQYITDIKKGYIDYDEINYILNNDNQHKFQDEMTKNDNLYFEKTYNIDLLNSEVSFKMLNYDEFIDKYNSDDALILVTTRSDCEYCHSIMPKYVSILEELDIPVIYFIDTSTLTLKQKEVLWTEYGINVVPTSIIKLDNGNKEFIYGDIEETTLRNVLKKLKEEISNEKKVN